MDKKPKFRINQDRKVVAVISWIILITAVIILTVQSNYAFFPGNYTGYNYNGSIPNQSSWSYLKDPLATVFTHNGTNFNDPYSIYTQGGAGGVYGITYFMPVKFTNNFWTVQLQGVSNNAGGNQNWTLRINNTLINTSTSAVTNGNYSFNVTKYNDGTFYNLSLQVAATGAVGDNYNLTFWWNNFEINPYTAGGTPSNPLIIYNLYNESNNARIIGTLVSNYAIINGTTGSYSFTQSNINNITYCLSPNVNIGIQANVTASATNFITRTFSFEQATYSPSNPLTKNLYLLDTNSGAYVTFQVVDSAATPIPNAYVTAQKVIGGSTVTIASGFTDSSGGVTFWLDPTSGHTITASKSGYPTDSESITPTQSSYTIVLGTTTTNITSYYWGMNYNLLPTEITLNNNTIYNFTFNLSSSYWNLTNYGFTLINSTGGILNTSTGTNTQGSLLSVLLNTNNLSSVTMNYFWNINNNFINQSQTWNIKPTYTGSLSIKNFFNDFALYSGVGFGAGYTSFGNVILAIIIIVGFTGYLSYEFGIYSPKAIMGVIFLLVYLLETINIIPTIANKQYLITVIVGLFWLGFIIQEESR